MMLQLYFIAAYLYIYEILVLFTYYHMYDEIFYGSKTSNM